jgi:regulator of ribonuclease activity A
LTTSDLLDEHGDRAQVCELQFRRFGSTGDFSGELQTVRCLEDNVLLKQELSTPGRGRVLVVDAGGTYRCAVLGDNIAALARDNGWAAIVVNGCVRDLAGLREVGLPIKALGTNPRPSGKAGDGEIGATLQFGGATFRPGDTLVSDEDGLVVLPAQA